jgi:glyoxylase-like metal-dependent hydrolase (beta-lactamase superfamily II)
MSSTGGMTEEASNTWSVGSVRIQRIVEFELPAPGELLFPEATVEAVHAQRDWLGSAVTADGWLMLSNHGFVIDDGQQRILVDGGIGDGKPRPNPFFSDLDTGFRDRLTAAGCAAESIDTVVVTHLHPDHVGWCTSLVDGRWLPTFPNATHLVVKSEWEYWQDHLRAERDGDYLSDSMRPVEAAGLIDLVATDHAVTRSIRLELTPGHCPGHVSVHIESNGESAVITGDVLHHPIQCAEPDWTCIFDEDSAQATRTRRQFLTSLAETDTLVLGTHFASPTAGRIVRSGDAWRFVP